MNIYKLVLKDTLHNFLRMFTKNKREDIIILTATDFTFAIYTYQNCFVSYFENKTIDEILMYPYIKTAVKSSFSIDCNPSQLKLKLEEKFHNDERKNKHSLKHYIMYANMILNNVLKYDHIILEPSFELLQQIIPEIKNMDFTPIDLPALKETTEFTLKRLKKVLLWNSAQWIELLQSKQYDFWELLINLPSTTNFTEVVNFNEIQPQYIYVPTLTNNKIVIFHKDLISNVTWVDEPNCSSNSFGRATRQVHSTEPGDADEPSIPIVSSRVEPALDDFTHVEVTPDNLSDEE